MPDDPSDLSRTEPGRPDAARADPEEARHRRAVLLVMCVGYFLVLLDVTIVNVALPSIASGLGSGVSDLQWVVDGYAVALAGLMLTGGTLGDARGHKRVVLAGLVLFGAASLGCGLVGSAGALIAFRVLQGTGAALLLPGTLAVIGDTFPEARERARAIGIWAGVGGSALVAGPVLGGVLVQVAGWRWVFLVNVPIVVAAAVASARTVRETPVEGTARPDLAGAVLGAAVLTTITFAFIEGGRVGVGVPVLAAATVAVVSAAALVAAERRADAPMLPLEVVVRRPFLVANGVAGAMNFATLGLLFLMTLYLQDVRGLSPLTAGLALLPAFLPLSVLGPTGGRLTARHGPRTPMLAGSGVAGAGVLLLVIAGRDTAYVALVPALLLWGCGLAILTPAVVSAAVAAVPPDRSGLGSAVNNTARQASGAIGIAVFGALASDPGGPGFLPGLHLAVVTAAGLLTLAATATAFAIPRDVQSRA